MTKAIMRIVEWVKTHKLASVLMVILLGFILKSWSTNFLGYKSSMPLSLPSITEESAGIGGVANPAPLSNTSLKLGRTTYTQDTVAPVAGGNRMVIENSYLSLLVKDVVDVRKKIIAITQENSGYMVESNISNPQDAPTATVTVRVPSKNLEPILDSFRKLAVKVVTENLTGTDVTDQFVDIAKNIAILEKTKLKFEEILGRAQEISDITNLNQQIINIQAQIDSYKGRQDYLAKNAELAKITVYLSTDEMALPYAPSETFRPSVIFKLAIRSLVSDLRHLATALIWILVYAVIWVPLFFIAKFVYRRFLKKTV